MSEIFIEWDRDRLVVAEGQPSGGRAAFGFVEVLERAADPNDTLALVDGLQKLFPGKSDRKRLEATVVFPRQLVTFHRIQLPQVPDSDVPDMLKMQAAMKLTVPVESVAMDFTPLPLQAGSPTRDVLLVTVPGDQLAIVRRTLNDAGLELSEARVSGYCVAQALAANGMTHEGDGVDVVAVLRTDFVELTFLRGSTVLYSHSGSSWNAADAIERTVRSELSRARMSASEVLGEQKVRRIVLLGSPDITSQVSDQLGTRFDNAVIERVDPAVALFGGTLPASVSSASVVALAGAVCESTVNVPSIDLVNPRKAPEKRDLRRIRILLGLLAGVVVMAGGYFYRTAKVQELKDRKDLVERENAEYREAAEAGEKDLVLAEKVQHWVDRDIEWLDEIIRLKSYFPPADRMYVDNITMSPIPQNGVGSIRMEALAKSDVDINELARRLDEAGYQVRPFEPEFRSNASSPDYQVRVVMEIILPEATATSG
ncbi:MAG: hypothetical protein JNM43_16160 [Planctomycetaceae bacterium]|nr:hypothetical protein [Planctomycetaceae bacterium]